MHLHVERRGVRTPCFAVCFVSRLQGRWRACLSSQTRSENVTIRTARLGDAGCLARLVMESFRDTRETSLPAPLRALVAYAERGDLIAQFRGRLQRQRTCHALLVAESIDDEIGAELIGCIEVGVLRAPQGVAEGDVARAWERRATPSGGVPNGGGTEPVAMPAVALDVPYVGNLSVTPGYRRQGIGGRLVDAAENEARAWGATTIALHVDVRNPGAQALYQQRGYRCRAREPEWYPAVGRLQRLFLDKALHADSEQSSTETYCKCPVVHTRPLSALEYLRWCLYDLDRRNSKKY